MDIKAGRILNNHLFEILEKRGDEVVSVKYKGVWLLCDNGYHNWSITVPPVTKTICCNEI